MSFGRQSNSENTQKDARAGYPTESKVVTLKRPHTLLLIASVTGGYAKRGAYSCAFAEQMGLADGVISITDMETKARTEMLKNDPECKDQTPDMRNTLMKKLVLPPRKGHY